MSEANCTGSCSTCSADCASRKPSKEELLEPANKFSKIKRVIGVVSGKGGVGKSFVTSCLTAAMQKKGYQTAILDADVTGPSIPKSFGISGKTGGSPQGMVPAVSSAGTKVMSVNLLVDQEDTPVLWRGPVVAGVVKQFWSEVFWDQVDYMFVDMPPGTGDVPLTAFQSLPLDGIILVTSPQDLVSMIVKKAVNMAKAMEIPILGMVENYSYMQCKCCGEKQPVFGESHIDEIAAELQLPVLAKLPLDFQLAQKVDQGLVEEIQLSHFEEMAAYVEKVCPITEEAAGPELVAVAIEEDGQMAAHFNKCQYVRYYEINEGQVKKLKEENVPEVGNEPFAKYLLEKKVQVVLCHGIGFPAMQKLMEEKITVLPGQKGDADSLVEAYKNGEL